MLKIFNNFQIRLKTAFYVHELTQGVLVIYQACIIIYVQNQHSDEKGLIDPDMFFFSYLFSA